VDEPVGLLADLRAVGGHEEEAPHLALAAVRGLDRSLDDQLQVLLRDWIGLERSHRPLGEHRLADRHSQTRVTVTSPLPVTSPRPAQPVTDRAAHYQLEVAALEPR
jgi:hypothetical protein